MAVQPVFDDLHKYIACTSVTVWCRALKHDNSETVGTFLPQLMGCVRRLRKDITASDYVQVITVGPDALYQYRKISRPVTSMCKSSQAVGPDAVYQYLPVIFQHIWNCITFDFHGDTMGGAQRVALCRHIVLRVPLMRLLV